MTRIISNNLISIFFWCFFLIQSPARSANDIKDLKIALFAPKQTNGDLNISSSIPGVALGVRWVELDSGLIDGYRLK